MKHIIFVSLFMISALAFAQENDNSNIKKGGIVAAGVTSGTISFLKMRKEVIYKSNAGVHLDNTELKKLAKLIKPTDKIIIRRGDAIGNLKYRTYSFNKPSQETVESLLKQAQAGNSWIYIKSIERVENKVTINMLKRVKPVELGLAALSIGGAGYQLATWNSGKSNKAASRFNSSRSVVEKTSGSSHKRPARNTANVSRQ